MKKIILIGAGGHARTCIDIITNTKKYKIEYLFEKKDNSFIQAGKIILR